MRYPLGFVYDSAKYLAARKWHGHRKFAFVLTLNPLGGGAGQRADPNGSGEERAALSVEQCMKAVQECDAPIVRICGGEPLEYAEIGRLAREILATRRQVFLCTDGTLIRRRLHLIPPETNFFWNVRLDGPEEVHDRMAGREGVFREALDGIKSAKNAGFFVVVNTTICPDTNVRSIAELYERLHALHVDGYSLLPAYAKNPMCKQGSATFYEQIRYRFLELQSAVGCYNLLNSPIYIEYLRGERELDCCVWGSPEYGPKGWVVPCSVLNQGHEVSYRELLENTVWENYGRGLNPSCETCMCESGYETAAVLGTNPKAGDAWKMLTWPFRGNLGEKRERAQKA